MTQQKDNFSSLSVEQLQGYFSDFHKDFYGWRPRYLVSSERWNDRDYLIEQINQIFDVMESMKATFQGREELRERGWVIEEEDPTLAGYAKWLADEREREFAEWSAELDAGHYAKMH